MNWLLCGLLAAASLTAGTHQLRQRGRTGGWLYSEPARDAKVHHWVLTPGYGLAGAVTVVRDRAPRFADPADFLARVPFPTGSSYVRATFEERDHLPPSYCLEDDDSSGRTYDLYVSGRKVGERFVPPRTPGYQQFVEHWVLFPAYHTRGRKPLRIVPRAKGYRHAGEFVERVHFTPGSRYALVVAVESDALPGR